MKTIIARLIRDEAGAISVDWVVLTAAMVGLGVALTLSIGQAATVPAESVGNFLTDRPVRD